MTNNILEYGYIDKENKKIVRDAYKEWLEDTPVESCNDAYKKWLKAKSDD